MSELSGPSLPGYNNLELIGKGGFSRVYKADQSKLKRKVAVKVLNFGLNDQADRVSFARETELMGRVSTHPNIVTVHDTTFTAEGQPCIVMEHYPGGSLADLINEIGRLNTHEALEVGVTIASALEASHQAGVLHCDLKPQNILISEFGQPALGDFGISTFAEDRTFTGQDAGAGFTLPYAAPEIVEGESPTLASDIYSLAATLYTSLCGRRPFVYESGSAKPTAAEQARRILVEPVQSLVSDGVPPELDALICGSMSKDPAARPTSAAMFASECHEIGQRLGLGTSRPRIADHGALPRLPTDAVGQGQIDLSVLRDQRRIRPEAVPPEVAAPNDAGSTEESPAGISTRRRGLAGLSAAVSFLIVAVVLFLATRGGSNDVTDTDAATADDAIAQAAVLPPPVDPAFAPTRPTNVTLERLANQSVQVTWQVPEAELQVGDVTYEVRSQDGGSFTPVVSTTDQAVLPAIADDEPVCVTVLAIRSNRAANPTETVCLSAARIDVVLEPANCVAPCDLRVLVTGASDGEPHGLAIVDRSLADMDENGFILAPTFVPTEGSPVIEVTENTTAGSYLIRVTFPDDRTQAALFTVESGN